MIVLKNMFVTMPPPFFAATASMRSISGLFFSILCKKRKKCRKIAKRVLTKKMPSDIIAKHRKKRCKHITEKTFEKPEKRDWQRGNDVIYYSSCVENAAPFGLWKLNNKRRSEVNGWEIIRKQSKRNLDNSLEGRNTLYHDSEEKRKLSSK